MAGDHLDAPELDKSVLVSVAVEEGKSPVDLLAVGRRIVGGGDGFSIRARGIRGRCADFADLGRLVIVFELMQCFLDQGSHVIAAPLESVPCGIDVTFGVAGAHALEELAHGAVRQALKQGGS
ncbi:hypothetical protein [Variovorax sp. RA8]|uniref:hypothetical protein n=1 Tax=Variovorax sp. (strain JCM 16519 / RA8) TaxID=662548 RepID=UPI001318BF93|nr:hypothetical protein [Variovorax sp. RA8]VTU44921.1 hypothetical protein RA8P2_00357 [Variovorax sp. RA8]